MKHILMAEDDRFMANVCREKLESAGYRVALAHDGHEAVEQLALNPPDLVLLDLNLPEIDGLGVLRFLRSREALCELPVIVVSNSTYFSGVVQAAWKAGATHFLNKGDCSPVMLVEEVRKVVPPGTPSPPAVISPSTAPAPAVPPRPTKPVSKPPGGKVRMLLADDDPIIHGVLSFFMKQSCIEVRSAFNGREALEMAAADPPDVLVLDGMMPELDGCAVLAEWRRNPVLAPIPVIMLTGLDDEANRAGALAAGAAEFLTKPFSPDELVAKTLHYGRKA